MHTPYSITSDMKEIKTPKPVKVLLITHEFGRRIAGGVGRIVNGMFTIASEKVILDVFLIKFPAMVDTNFAYVYRKNKKNKANCLYLGEYKEILLLALQQEQYDQVHIIANSMYTSECLRIIKKKLS